MTADAATLTPKGTWWTGKNADSLRNLNSTLLVEAMVSCTAITYVKGSLVGDPLDVQMFEATGWILDETEQREVSADGHDNLVIACVYPPEVINPGVK